MKYDIEDFLHNILQEFSILFGSDKINELLFCTQCRFHPCSMLIRSNSTHSLCVRRLCGAFNS